MARKHQFDKDPETGHMLEERYFGTIDTSGEKSRAASELLTELQSKNLYRRGIPSFRQALNYVKRFQPTDDPTYPETIVARDLYDAIAERLGLDLDDPDNGLKFYTAVGSPLDIYHGVDAFYEYNGHLVLIDVTKSLHKKNDDSSDNRIIMEALTLRKQNRAQYIKDLHKYAEQAADIFFDAIEREKEKTKETKIPHKGKDDFISGELAAMR